ncbi:hypothetical protein RhiJN_15983 [Ceratobasidium sp. AG-Ba]|nr:hypothetical protein RhiJN_15983 [Ceratobasidium sp. AG-Ba]
MSGYYDEFFPSLDPASTGFIDYGVDYNGIIEYDDQLDSHNLHTMTRDAYNELTPKLNQSVSQGENELNAVLARSGTLSDFEYGYDAVVSTPPLSPSTTISSIHTEENASFYRTQNQEILQREEIRRGKQPVVPSPEELAAENDESDWYGMEYAVQQSRMNRPDVCIMWPPTAGEPSTSDAAFLAMYWGYIDTQDIEYWYAHWCKWHRALAREDKRRRDRAASDAEYTRAYQHAEYVRWEQAQRKKYMQYPPGHVGSKPMKSSRSRHRSSTCLF